MLAIASQLLNVEIPRKEDSKPSKRRCKPQKIIKYTKTYLQEENPPESLIERYTTKKK